MRASELRKALEGVPDDAEVLIDNETDDGRTFLRSVTDDPYAGWVSGVPGDDGVWETRERAIERGAEIARLRGVTAQHAARFVVVIR
jgi:hypothetical protein